VRAFFHPLLQPQNEGMAEGGCYIIPEISVEVPDQTTNPRLRGTMAVGEHNTESARAAEIKEGRRPAHDSAPCP
jgi:hypothetical protein